MKTIILAGGAGTRFTEETQFVPKPMIKIAEKPIIWHLMKIFADQGFNEFIIATGYKSEIIHDWVEEELEEDWNVEAFYTGDKTLTGERVKLCIDKFNEPKFMLTYGDGLANVDIKKLLNFHESQKRACTVTAVRPPARYGSLRIAEGIVTNFNEKSQTDSGWINGGFFVINKEINKFINANDDLGFNVLPRLVQNSQLAANKHYGFWHPMDTLREKKELESIISSGDIPWSKIDS
jgi:glucose-1-phosphate cytidylyltransferase